MTHDHDLNLDFITNTFKCRKESCDYSITAEDYKRELEGDNDGEGIPN